MGEFALALQNGMGLFKPDELITFIGLSSPIGLSSRKSHRELTGSASKALKSISKIMDDLMLRLVDRKNADEFRQLRSEVFPHYFRILRALSDVVQVVVPLSQLERLLNESFAELEADFRNEGVRRFGASVADQAVFTAWTLRETSALLLTIQKNPLVSYDLKEKDSALASQFSAAAVWTQFHLDCLSAAIRFDNPIYPDILPEIVDGLRAAVNAYALARQGVDLRVSSEDYLPLTAPYEWDDEDQELMDSSMSDLYSTEQ
jgi:hypothetical protein